MCPPPARAPGGHAGGRRPRADLIPRTPGDKDGRGSERARAGTAQRPFCAFPHFALETTRRDGWCCPPTRDEEIGLHGTLGSMAGNRWSPEPEHFRRHLSSVPKPAGAQATSPPAAPLQASVLARRPDPQTRGWGHRSPPSILISGQDCRTPAQRALNKWPQLKV